MSPFDRQFASNSPVLAMAPQPAHQAPLSTRDFTQQETTAHTLFGKEPHQPASASTNGGSHTITSRKRSRDEAAVNLEPDAPPPLLQEPEEEWVYGPGMVLIKSQKTYVADASSQSGTWVEEKKTSDEEELRKQERERIAPRSIKSQRVFHDICPDISANSTTAPMAPASTLMNGSHGDNAPVIDKFTLHLGIGWRKISDDDHIQAAARGWARYIENHFPITNAQIRLESKGLQSYLVEAAEGFFLFAEDLRQGRLVSINAEDALRNLQTSPPTFDGTDILTAAESPAPTFLENTQVPVLDSDMQMD